jgi:large subunit ribosomal protein L6
MSKIGQAPIKIGEKVKVTKEGNQVIVEGPSGSLTFTLPEKLDLVIKDNQITITRSDDQSKYKALHGLYRQLINNAVIGVEKPWQKKLEVVGTGYNVKLQGEDLVFKLGYSHPVIFKKVKGVSFQVVENNKIIVSGADKQLVGQVAYQIKMLKKPDVYKGKGIRYEGERLRIKPGKKLKATTAA